MARRFRTVRELIYWEYAKLISERAVGERRNFRFVTYAFKRLCEGKMNPSSILSENKKLFTSGEICAYCGATDGLQWEHVIPLACGGPDSIDNMVRACAPCNQAKGARDPYQWYIGRQADTIPRVALGKFLKIIFDAYESAGVVDSEEYMKENAVQRVELAKILSGDANLPHQR